MFFPQAATTLPHQLILWRETWVDLVASFWDTPKFHKILVSCPPPKKNTNNPANTKNRDSHWKKGQKSSRNCSKIDDDFFQLGKQKKNLGTCQKATKTRYHMWALGQPSSSWALGFEGLFQLSFRQSLASNHGPNGHHSLGPATGASWVASVDGQLLQALLLSQWDIGYRHI